jgi:alpha-1,6-mannosyltransferase
VSNSTTTVVAVAHPDQTDLGSPRTCPRWLSTAAGAVGAAFICVGLSGFRTPFAVDEGSAWWFGLGRWTSSPIAPNDRLLGVALVYVGILFMLAAWFEIVRAARRQPGLTLRSLWLTALLWALPIVVMPPVFSRDVYSYAAQGEMVSRGLNPYTHSPSDLGASTYLRLVDPMWRHTHAPYGPAWERLSGWIVQLSRHHVAGSVMAFRLVALVGLALMAWGIPVLARSVGRSDSVAFALALLNPVVLLVLLGGAHNDALMLGLLVAGCALARRQHAVMGLVLVALAAEIKIPALIGAAFIGWWWSNAEAAWRSRMARLVGAIGISLGVMVALSAVADLGWRWVDGLSDPGVVVSWLDPATAGGLVAHHAASAFGFVGHQGEFLTAFRGLGLVVAAVISILLLWRSDRIGPMQALGWSLLAFVLLGPVIWPWYETWGFVFLAIVAEGLTLRLLLGLSALACFADLPPARVLFGAETVLELSVWVVLVALVVAYLIRRVMPSLARTDPAREVVVDLDAAP